MSLLLATSGGAAATIVSEDEWRPAIVVATLAAFTPAYADEQLPAAAVVTIVDESQPPATAAAPSSPAWIEYRPDESAIVSIKDESAWAPARAADVVAVTLAPFQADEIAPAVVATIVCEDEYRPALTTAALVYALLAQSTDEIATVASSTIVADDGWTAALVVIQLAAAWLPLPDDAITPAWLAEDGWTASTAVIAPVAVAVQVTEDLPPPRLLEDSSQPAAIIVQSVSIPLTLPADDITPTASVTVLSDDVGPALWWASERAIRILDLPLGEWLPGVAPLHGEALARESLSAYFASIWSGVPLTIEEEAFTPPAGSFVALSMRHTTRVQATQGERRFECRGYVFVQIFTALDVGAAPMAALVDQVRSVIERVGIAQAGTDEKIVTYGARTRELGVRVGRYMAVVIVPFLYYDVR